MSQKLYDLKYSFTPGLLFSYQMEGTTKRTFGGDAPEKHIPNQLMQLSLTMQPLYQDMQDRFHIIFRSTPIKILLGEEEQMLPDSRLVYSMVDVKGRILETTDPVNVVIFRLPEHPVPLGTQWETVEEVHPADYPEKLSMLTVFTLEEEKHDENNSFAVIKFTSPPVEYQSNLGDMEECICTFRREGEFHFDMKLCQISHLDQTTYFRTDTGIQRLKAVFRNVMDLGKIVEDSYLLPKKQE